MIEARAVLYCGGEGEGGEMVDPFEGRIAKGQKDQDFGSSETLISRLSRWHGSVGERRLDEMIVVFEHLSARSATKKTRVSELQWGVMETTSVREEGTDLTT